MPTEMSVAPANAKEREEFKRWVTKPGIRYFRVAGIIALLIGCVGIWFHMVTVFIACWFISIVWTTVMPWAIRKDFDVRLANSEGLQQSWRDG
jgi:hypothetical protein